MVILSVNHTARLVDHGLPVYKCTCIDEVVIKVKLILTLLTRGGETRQT